MAEQNLYYAPHKDLSKPSYDGKRMRKHVVRTYTDWNSPMINSLNAAVWERRFCKADRELLQPTAYDTAKLCLPITDSGMLAGVCARYQHTAINKQRCPVNRCLWTPSGRRLITGCSTGEFTLWNGQGFNFETILAAHHMAVRSLAWSNDEQWLISGDDGGDIKYWEPNMNSVKTIEKAHGESVRDLSFAPTSLHFVSCSDDHTLRLWDFLRPEERMRKLEGHGWDVKSVHWHPFSSLIASGSKDNRVKIWDARTARNVSTLHEHKHTVLSVRWNPINGNWLLSASRDMVLKLMDVRTMRVLETFVGQKKEVLCTTWHPTEEKMFASGGYDGSLCFWQAPIPSPVAVVRDAHDSAVWDVNYHPLGHVIATASNDHTVKFFSRQRPGDLFDDRPSAGGTGFGRVEGDLSAADLERLAEQEREAANARAVPGNFEVYKKRARMGNGDPALPGLWCKEDQRY